MTEIKRGPSIGKIAETAFAAVIYTGVGIAMRLNGRFRTHWVNEIASQAGVTGTIDDLDKWSIKFLPREQQKRIIEQIDISIQEHAGDRKFHEEVRERGWQR